ncbi:MAG: DUF3488 and transglutaminase-like domain-containing protein [Granulosicoccus sp.]
MTTAMAAARPGRFSRLFALAEPNANTLDERSLRAIAALLLLVQFPHLLHLPVWVSAAGASIIGLRLWSISDTNNALLKRLLSPFALTGIAVISALLIREHYGYFIGRDPCVAFLFLLVAAKFSEIRKNSDATFLMCLAAFLLLTQYFYAQTILSAIVTLPAVFALGHALAVLRDPGSPSTAIDHLRLIGKLLLQGTPIAVLLFVLFPRLPGPLWSLPEDAMATTGLSDSMSPGSIGALSQSDAVAFRVEFDTAPPVASSRYWRGPVLSEFDGQQWSLGVQTLAAKPQQLTGASVEYTVMLQPHRQHWLFALDAAVSLPQSSPTANASTPPLAHMMNDGQLLTDEPVAQVLRYRQRSVLSASFTPARYPDDSHLHLAGKNPKALTFATRLRATTESDSDYADALLSHFNRENFHYTLSPQLLGDNPVDEFLFASREGFCEHYASAFAVLMRAAGIPARVVTGYLGGEINGDYMIVRQSDAHAWTEAYIDGVWQRYDPTGAVAPSRVDIGISAAIPRNELPRLARLEAGWLRELQLGWDAINHDWQRFVINFDNDSQSELWEMLGLAKPVLWQITVAVLLAVAIWCLFVLGLPWGSARVLRREERAWLSLTELLNRKGIHREYSETPGEFLARAESQFPAQRERIQRLSQSFTKLRFTPHDNATHENWQAMQRDLWGLRRSLLFQRA